MTVTEETVPEEEDVARGAVVGGTAVEEDAAVAAELGEHAAASPGEQEETVEPSRGRDGEDLVGVGPEDLHQHDDIDVLPDVEREVAPGHPDGPSAEEPGQHHGADDRRHLRDNAHPTR